MPTHSGFVVVGRKERPISTCISIMFVLMKDLVKRLFFMFFDVTTQEKVLVIFVIYFKKISHN